MTLTISRLGIGLGAARPSRIYSNTDLVEVIGSIAMTTYSSGGMSLTPANIGLLDIQYFSASPAISGTSAGSNKLYIVNTAYDYSNKKLVCYGGSGVPLTGTNIDVEYADLTDLTGFTIRFRAIGKKATK